MSTVKKNFSRAATIYDNYSDIQTEMAKDLLMLISNKAQAPSSILDIGCGTGILTEKVHYAFPEAKITAMDISEDMIHMAQKKLSSPNITFILQDVESVTWTSSAYYDLILSNAVFQWLRAPKNTLHQVTRPLQKGGWLFSSTFGPQTFQELTSLFTEVEKELGLIHQIHHLPLKNATQWSSLLKEMHPRECIITEKKRQILYPDCRAFLHAIRAIGASYSQSRLSLIQQKKVLHEVMKRYDERYYVNGSVSATYHLMYMQCQW